MGKLSDFLKKLKKVNHIEIIACGVLLAAVLTVYFACASCYGKKSSTTDASSSDYCTAMQIRVEKIVSEISGVGETSVAINWDKSVSAALFGGQTENPKATGVIVVCKGGDDSKVKADVTQAVSTLLGISKSKIIVYKKTQ